MMDTNLMTYYLLQDKRYYLRNIHNRNLDLLRTPPHTKWNLRNWPKNQLVAHTEVSRKCAQRERAKQWESLDIAVAG